LTVRQPVSTAIPDAKRTNGHQPDIGSDPRPRSADALVSEPDDVVTGGLGAL